MKKHRVWALGLLFFICSGFASAGYDAVGVGAAIPTTGEWTHYYKTGYSFIVEGMLGGGRGVEWPLTFQYASFPEKDDRGFYNMPISSYFLVLGPRFNIGNVFLGGQAGLGSYAGGMSGAKLCIEAQVGFNLPIGPRTKVEVPLLDYHLFFSDDSSLGWLVLAPRLAYRF